jgi:hypothetical protein
MVVVVVMVGDDGKRVIDDAGAATTRNYYKNGRSEVEGESEAVGEFQWTAEDTIFLRFVSGLAIFYFQKCLSVGYAGGPEMLYFFGCSET